jgi:hypothetical protein
MRFSYTDSDGEKSLVVTGEAGTRLVPSNHRHFDEIVEGLFEGEDSFYEWFEEYIFGLIDFTESAKNTLEKLSERVTLKNGNLYFDGDLVDNSLTRHIIRMIDGKDNNWQNFVKFMENIATNPSKTSRLHLFRWLDERDFTIDDNGHIVGYKGVTNTPTNLSVNSGRAFVNGVEINGHIPNEPGSVIEMPRSAVNPDRDTGCSTGLHVGTYDYASRFGAKLLTVAVNPRDVVSVPGDCNEQKMRCCRYRVIGTERNQIENTTVELNLPAEDDFFKDGEWLEN